MGETKKINHQFMWRRSSTDSLTNSLAVLIGLGLFFLCDAFFLIDEWAPNPWGVANLDKGFGIDFTPTLFESSFALLEVRSVVLGTNDGDEDDEGSYDTDEDTLDLIIRGLNFCLVFKEKKRDVQLHS